ncbi:hypothetical protein K450DRAFT_196087 [Umbelopsis ramanniana AG]|uniref:Uncharacterized protein n=1 Tax=Umbelopsis ramanniana AG TaxID=1314678 RepID=A0AAD5HII2_UMBRA|nr:uncharacterized protein K450DRAFT_196087 [Umbelopsis ramanniana AG]KAI8583308.1 hypothetical protein K450DRAFT_196087 [Umbelopsis ramanniana AG]
MRLHLILALFLAFSFAQAIAIKKREALDKFLAIDMVESKVDAVVALAKQLQTSPFINPVKFITTYRNLQDAISNSTDLCMSHPDPFTEMQAENLISRTMVIATKLEGVLVICERLASRIGIFSPTTVFRVLLNQMKTLLMKAASCYSSHVPPEYSAKIVALLKAINQILDESLAKAK